MSAVRRRARIEYISAGAIISPCGRYRYRLWREWRTPDGDGLFRDMGFVDGAGQRCVEPETCVFVMLNPSTADGTKDDPTIKKCVAFADAWGFRRLEVLNLFAHRATDPAALLALDDSDDPVGPENHEAFDAVLDNQPIGRIVCAWGTKGAHLDQGRTAYGWLLKSRVPATRIVCLRRTKHFHPEHPLYLPYTSQPRPFTI